jgi:WXXGXW repeat (2 copies)
MKNFIRAALLVAVLSVTASANHAQVSVGIVIGAPPPPRVAVVIPARPAPEFVWVEGYWYPVGKHYKWHEGYRTRPPYERAHWVAPHQDGERFYAGYWEGNHGRVEHDHHTDHDRDRDSHDHDQHGDHDHGRDDR